MELSQPVSTGSVPSGRGRLGAGLVAIPPVPPRDPTAAILADPQVPVDRRFCRGCGLAVGRGTAAAPAQPQGDCPYCGTRYDFRPRLTPGELVGDRYQVLGALAHGGLGWIHLARDRHVSDEVAERWVVLKGLIDHGDAEAMAAAVSERRFLVEVDHPGIVTIHDFVSHPDPTTGEPVSYLVMEYVGGRSLTELQAETPTGALPLPQVLAYGLEVLTAFGYLHERGLLFCDFKTGNLIHTEEQLKLIDLGAVRRIGDRAGTVWGTPGYQAPEVPQTGPSISSDLYTVGRTMAVLALGIPPYMPVPEPSDHPLLTAHEPVYRWLSRATWPEPAGRFGSAAEMAEQLLGVLRQVAAAADGRPRPGGSDRFTGERQVLDVLDPPAAGTVADALPIPLADVTDPAAGWIASLPSGSPAERLAALAEPPVRSPEVARQLVRTLLAAGDPAAAEEALPSAAPPAGSPPDWRTEWYRGLTALAQSELATAYAAFDRVYELLPGELAPPLALAAVAELSDRPAAAELPARPAAAELPARPAAADRYAQVWRTDRGWVGAAFGLARCRRRAGDRAAAAAVLEQVPEHSRHHLTAAVAAVRVRLAAPPAGLSTADLRAASDRLERLTVDLDLDLERRTQLTVELLSAALGRVTAGGPEPATGILGRPLTERPLRFGLERAYRVLAKLAPDTASRIELVDRANSVRPRTLW